MSDRIQLHQEGGVFTITLNRPDKLNAFVDDMREQLIEALGRVGAARDARALVVTGAGRAFCAGGDVQHMVSLQERGAGFEALQPLLDAGREIVTRLEALAIPTIAAVNGVAAGAGLNLALACDLRIASAEARFAATFVKIGLHPDWGGTYHLPRLVGVPKALEMCWLGDPVEAAEALRIGLVNRVVAPEALAAETGTVAARLAGSPRTTVRLVKQTLRGAFHRTLAQCLDVEAGAQAECWSSPDASEGLRAFVEKRAPRFGQAGAGGGEIGEAHASRGRFE